jgi:hypothetical protein
MGTSISCGDEEDRKQEAVLDIGSTKCEELTFEHEKHGSAART